MMAKDSENDRKKLTSILREMIQSQKDGDFSGALWFDSPVSSKMAQEMAASCFRLTNPVMNHGRVIVTHERMARAEMATHLKALFEEHWSWILEDSTSFSESTGSHRSGLGAGFFLPLWVKKVLSQAMENIDWSELAATWTTRVRNLEEEDSYKRFDYGPDEEATDTT